MPRPKHTPEIIIGKLREVEVLVAKGATVAEASHQIGVTEQTLYRWRKEYGGMRIDQARRLKDLEAENTRLKKLVADLSLEDVRQAVFAGFCVCWVTSWVTDATWPGLGKVVRHGQRRQRTESCRQSDSGARVMERGYRHIRVAEAPASPSLSHGGKVGL